MQIKTYFMMATLAVVPGLAMAQQAVPASAPMLGMIEILQKLESQGYTNFEDADRDRNYYEITATNSAGQRVELEVDGQSGNVLNSEPEV